jgi:hypothetical protein
MKKNESSKVYVVTELSLWDGIDNHNVCVYNDINKALAKRKEKVDNFLSEHNTDGYNIYESHGNFECNTNDGFSGNHFCVWIEAQLVL